jgi:hypothetical protein
MTNKEIQILVADVYAKLKVLNDAINKDETNKTQGLIGTIDKSFVCFQTEDGTNIRIDNSETKNEDEDNLS